MIDLNSYRAIESNLLVLIVLDNQTITMTDSTTPITVNGYTFEAMGKLLAVSSSNSDLRPGTDDISVAISGIPNTMISEVINSRFKGSQIEVARYLKDPVTGTPLSITPNPVGRFFGIINNYSLQEDYDNEDRSASNTIELSCSTLVRFLQGKVPGRRTNPLDIKAHSNRYFNYTDLSFDRVPNLTNAYFNFGAPQ